MMPLSFLMATRFSNTGRPSAKPGCDVAVHYLFFVLRTLPPPQVFAQIAFGYALAAADPRRRVTSDDVETLHRRLSLSAA
jgi:hypothetical protein